MKLAAVDIGSNAARLQVSSVLFDAGRPKFKRLEYLRFPLRLGYDVFKNQCISTENEQRLIQLLRAFKILIDLYGVNDYMVCATAAFRGANNRQKIVYHIQEVLSVVVHIIKGEEEASLIHEAIYHLLEQHSSYLHVDVGGGSTEVNLYVGCKKIASRSFDLGSIRALEHNDAATTWVAMRTWITTQKQHLPSIPIGIATGGNIRKLAQLAKKRGIKKPFSLRKLEATKDYIATHSLEERINSLELNPDRAEAILPAMDIYCTAMDCGGVEQILVPEVGLKDGIIQTLYKKLSHGSTLSM